LSGLIRAVHFLRLGRPLFLAGGVTLYLLGVAMALYQGAALDVGVLVLGQIAVTAIQVMTHYSNDYFDLAADRANLTPTRWSGGSGILPAGLIAPRTALLTALGAGLLALVLIGWLALRMPAAPLTAPLLLLALFLAWSYSAPPLQLHAAGVGEVAAAVLIAGLTPLSGYYLQMGQFTWLPILAVLPLINLQAIMLLLIQFPDARGDAAVGKKTITVRLGAPRTARLLQGLIVLHFLALPLLAVAGLPASVALAVAGFSSPGLLWLFWRLRQGVWARPAWWNWLGFTGIALVVGAAIMELVFFVHLFAAN
jgi:1,4-dihydroxy-2-naphthoate polyprenyltransferase